MAGTLLGDLCQLVMDADLENDTKIMICLVCTSIKDFEPGFDKVKQATHVCKPYFTIIY